MIQALLHKCISVSMAFIVLCSTFSFSIEKHFCGDFLVDVAIFSEVKSCCDQTKDTEKQQVDKNSCCKDVVDIIEGQDQLQYPSFEDLDLDQKVFLTAFTYGYVSLFDALPKRLSSYEYYEPPNLIYEIHKLDQVYLI